MTPRHRAFIARPVGIVSIALGFVMGMHGLEHPDSIWLPTALGLIVTGLLAQGYALYSSLRRWREKNESER
ncbi:MAG: hypothetical protein ACREI2_02955 [Nitrospiraceae bacterium]